MTLKNACLSLPSQGLGIIWIWQQLLGWVSGKCDLSGISYHCAGSLVSQWGRKRKSPLLCIALRVSTWDNLTHCQDLKVQQLTLVLIEFIPSGYRCIAYMCIYLHNQTKSVTLATRRESHLKLMAFNYRRETKYIHKAARNTWRNLCTYNSPHQTYCG